MRNFIRLKHSLAFLVALMAGASLLAACSSAPSASSTPTPKVQNGGTLNIGIPTAPEALDPSTEASFVGHWVFANMCYGLYGFSVKNQVVPVLATGLPTISDGGLLYTIHVRQGVRFNDGTAMTAEAVKTSLVRDKTLPTSARAAALADISSITVVNKYTVQLRLSQVDAPLTSILASRSGIVMSPTALAREGANFGNDPVCVGPFSFQSRPSLDQINLTRSKYFYGKKPAVQQVIYHVITDPATCYSDLLSGAINVAECLAPNDVKLLDGNSAYRVQQVTSDGYSMIVINVGNVAGSLKKTYGTADNPLAKYPVLRQALAMSINSKTINNVVYDGTMVPGCSPIPPSSPYFTAVPCPKYDPAAAKKLVEQSGAPTPVDLTLMVDTGTLNVEEGEVIADEAKAAGFNITVQPTEGTTAAANAESGNFEMYLAGWSGRIDPDQNISIWYTPGSALNFSGADYPTLNTLLAEGRGTENVAQRKAIYAKVVKYLDQKEDSIYLMYTTYQIAYPKSVVGLVFDPNGNLMLAGAGIKAG